MTPEININKEKWSLPPTPEQKEKNENNYKMLFLTLIAI